MTHNTCTFSHPATAALFCATLTREGIAFRVEESADVIVVTITGY